MNGLTFSFVDHTLTALPSGALWWPAEATLVVSDLHLGKAERMARRGGPILPPYEIQETLDRLIADCAATGAKRVICLGDSFDDLAAAQATAQDVSDRLAPTMAGRQWIWIEGNHDPGPVGIGGEHLSEVKISSIAFRHIASESSEAEVSGHYHPKARVLARGRTITRPCFLVDDRRLILPAFGTYTGGLHCDRPELASLMAPNAAAILLADPPVRIPMPR
ncbi:ligase-associated DNA damage response endonuclease PdeM [Gymnodinialimonas hymeniacidonis]|uniref:ligase-associated DNA damage response endonuclease PdeM n=1 Tax=Gymnodinialimonas hymeniacidonis TaxID=3126508 RepID=UPI0034C6030B